MKIGVIHEVNDPEAFTERGNAMVEESPEGVENLQAYPSQDLTKCTCLWDAESVEQLSEFIDPSLGDASSQEYFPVMEEQAVGLPQ